MPYLQPGGQYKAEFIFQNAAVATGNGTAMETLLGGALTALLVYISIATTATVTFEGTHDGTTWFSIAGTDVASTTGAMATSATASGAYRFNLLGLKKVRMRISAWTSGAVTVKGNAVA